MIDLNLMLVDRCKMHVSISEPLLDVLADLKRELPAKTYPLKGTGFAIAIYLVYYKLRLFQIKTVSKP